MRTSTHSSGSATELLLLGLLADEGMHGYELKRRIDTAFGALMTMSWGSLYPALAKLERRGLIRSETTNTPAFDSRQLSGALAAELALLQRGEQPANGRRNRKVYTITTAGQTALLELLRGIALDDDRTFWFALAFSDHLTEAERIRLFERRVGLINERMRALGELSARSNGLGQVKHGLEYRLDAELQWIERELKDLREQPTLSR
ncbi:MAG: PadR family transcriptional regulator [Ferrimicrobium sp.]|uniref:PadR family transcriptional regulator n=1 Tax=Ferrimicrobium sp. TaxID=2926050 RepID=UPI0026291A12|nr:PadR family transcriptional regulator [Ferrimicrobium sp.]